MDTEVQKNSTEYTDEMFTLTVEKLKGCRAVFSIVVNEKGMADTYKHATKRINKEVSIPGFRKGRAPEKVIRQNYASHIDDECKKLVVQVYLFKGMDLARLYPINDGFIDKPKLINYSLESTEFSVQIEHMPIVPDLDYSLLTADAVPVKEVSDEDVEAAIKELREGSPELKEVTGRPAAEGDHVSLDIKILDDNAEVKQNADGVVEDDYLYREMSFELSEGQTGKWMRDAIIGQEVGAGVETETELDDTASEEVKAGFAPTKCLLELKGIFQNVVPELTDEFAKKHNYDDVAAFRSGLKEELAQDAKQAAEDLYKGKVEDKILELYSFEVPISIWEQEREARVKRRIKELKDEKVSEEEILAREGDIEKEVEAQVDTTLRLFYLYTKISQEQKLSVTQDEVAKSLESNMMFAMTMQYAEPEMIQRIKNQVEHDLLHQKVVAFILEKVAGSNNS